MAEALLQAVRWLLGMVTFTVTGEHPWRFLSRAAKLGYSLWGIAPGEEGEVRASVRRRAWGELLPLAAGCGCTLTPVKETGAHRLLAWLGNRKGVPVGLVLAVGLYAQLAGRVWHIEVNGCDAYTREEVLAVARACGLTTGTAAASFDPRSLGDAMMLRLSGVGWISVNTRGCFVEIELREAIPKTEIEEKEGLSIISAARDGQIVSCQALVGRLLVTPGQVVSRGEMLVTGVLETAEGGQWFVNAHASIMARTWRTFTAELPVTVEVEEPTGEVHTRRSLRLFTLAVPLGAAAAPTGQGMVERWEIPLRLLGVEVPAGLCTERWTGTRTICHQRSEEELRAAAEEILLEQAARALGESGEIEEMTLELSVEGDICTARLSCTCVEDIAQEIPIVLKGKIGINKADF